MKMSARYCLVAGGGFLAAVMLIAVVQYSHTKKTTTSDQPDLLIGSGDFGSLSAGERQLESIATDGETESTPNQPSGGFFTSGIPVSASLELSDPIPGIETELDQWLKGPLVLDSGTAEAH